MANRIRKTKIKFNYNSKVTSWKLIHDLLELAMKKKKEGPFAKYLIGSSLQLTFPDLAIDNTTYAPDNPNILFDYHVGDTVFNIKTAPIFHIYEKCQRNIEKGLRVYLIVPEEKLPLARENVEEIAAGRITVESIESFVSQNLEELSNFSKDLLAHGFYRLLKTYNERVDAVEIDKSMLIEIPRNLAHYTDRT
ncbi:MAG: DUF4928 family protein [Syntrophales bacterium]|nr:DUF4928 family protein [Syntrophales bacterium]